MTFQLIQWNMAFYIIIIAGSLIRYTKSSLLLVKKIIEMVVLYCLGQNNCHGKIIVFLFCHARRIVLHHLMLKSVVLGISYNCLCVDCAGIGNIDAGCRSIHYNWRGV